MWQFIAGWLLVQWRWSHLKITPALVDIWQDSETSLRKSCLDNFQHWYLSDMLASVYSYHVMVKSISCCCVHGRRVTSNPVTYIAQSIMVILLELLLPICIILILCSPELNDHVCLFFNPFLIVERPVLWGWSVVF